MFASALNIHHNEAEFVRAQLLEAAIVADATPGKADDYGQRYSVDWECVKGSRRALIRSASIVLKSEDFPRLLTCYVL